MRTTISMLVLASALLSFSAAAQDFVFVSTRLRADPPVSPSGTPLWQNEIYRYQDGSEIRLTFTPTENEWDPQPSPSGRFLAYFASDTVIDWSADELPETWQWYLRVLDMESLLLLEEWHIPSAAGTTRVAGGFDIAWAADESWLLAQTVDAGQEGSITRFTVGEPQPQVLSRGLGVHIDPASGWFATALDGYLTVVDPGSGNQYPLIEGEPLGWIGGRVAVGGAGPLLLIDPVSAERTPIDSSGDYYPLLASSPDGSRHAWISYQLSGTGTTLTVADASFTPIASWLHHDFVDSLVWLDEESLLLTGLLGDNMAITLVRYSDGTEFELVATRSDNLNTRVMPD